MFVLAVLIYPVVLGLLCLGAGLLVERAAGAPLRAALLPVVGAAGLIGLSQWTTYVPSLAPLTPWAMVLAAAAGLVAGRRRALALARSLATGAAVAPLAATLAGYVVAAAPVLFAGRVTFAAYNVLPDSALHMIGADYLVRHGQEYAHLDLTNSYGQYIRGYFASSYPSGSHTLFGGSAGLLPDLPLIWALQPFCACLLALAVGPAWVLARRLGLQAAAAAVAAVTISMPALVYGYALVGSIKELVALPLILALGALVADRPPGKPTPTARGALPFALVAAGGVSALGVSFSAWAGAAALVLAARLTQDVRAGRARPPQAAAFIGAGLAAGLAAAWPTWVDVPGSLQAAEAIAGTPNPGNLYTPLHATQIFGTWLDGSYQLVPGGHLTDALIAITAAAALLGATHVLRRRYALALAAWSALGLAVWLVLTAYGRTWTDAKILMLTSPVVLLLAWGGVAGLRGTSRLPGRVAAPLLGLALAGGVLASDEMQYRATDLAPTARYTELASLDGRFGPGPTLVPDFDEWALYVLRKVDVGGPDFVYRPAALAAIAPHHGDPVDLDAAKPEALRAYPLIVTGRDPTASRPPAAYRELYEGTYYEVWGRRPGAPAAAAHLGLDATQAPSCPAIGQIARVAGNLRTDLTYAAAPEIVPIDLAQAAAPASWRRPVQPQLGVLIRRTGQLRATFTVPQTGAWNLWVQGEVMPATQIGLDGRRLATIAGQLRGNVYNPDTLPPIAVTLTAGTHVLTIARVAATPAPGDGGSATLHALFLTPAAAGSSAKLGTIPPDRWRALCGRRLDWVEIVDP